MKNIIVISGSHRKNGAGISLLNKFKAYFDESEYSFETIHLSNSNVQFCRGCTVCFKIGEHACPCKDDVLSIVEKIKSSDGLIIISPIYGMNISGQLKTFLDRITYLYHRPTLIGKPAVFMSSTDLGGHKLVSAYMEYIMNTMGLRTIGSVGIYSKDVNQNSSLSEKVMKKLEKISSEFKEEMNSDEMPVPKFNELFHFVKWQVKNKLSGNVYPADHAYWSDKGWLDSDYYYPTNIKVFDKFRLKLVRKNIRRLIKKRL